MGQNSADFDVIIIGGGPAGLSAAFWCAELGLKAIIFEQEASFGGQLLWTFNRIKNYLGIDEMSGLELRDRFLQHVENTHVQRCTGAKVVDADLVEKSVTLSNGVKYVGKAVIIATGIKRRKLNVPGEEKFHGRGILESGVKARDDVGEKKVVIVGGGDAALENALILSRNAASVRVVLRGDQLRARSEFIDEVKERPNIALHLNCLVTAIVGNEEVEAVTIVDNKTGGRLKLDADALLIRIGVTPNTELFIGRLELDDSDYVLVDSRCATNIAGVYAVGDVANPTSPTINSAAGMGATAAKAVREYFSLKYEIK